jgi:GntR family negative regulator for fad regulon and positive regulator of fabA
MASNCPRTLLNLLDVLLVLAPAYTRAAVINSPEMVLVRLSGHTDLEDTPEALAAFDWALHHTLTVASGFYQGMACLYFSRDRARAASRGFYQNLRRDAVDAERITRSVMQESIVLWHEAGQQVGPLGGGS